MPLRSRWLMSAAMAVSINGATAHARGGEAPNGSLAACAGAYERSQEHRQVGELLAARSELATCALPECPEFIRSDCSRWSSEIDTAQPTVVFSVRRGAERLTEVRVSSGDKIITEHLEGQAVDLDPGAYDFRFETDGSSPVIKHAVIGAGSKGQLVQVEFADPTVGQRVPAAKSRPAPSSAAHAETAASVEPGPRALPWTLVAVGAASIGAGVALSTWGRSGELDLRRTCAPACSDASVQRVHTKYLFADISFGVGLTSLAAAVYLFAHDRAARPAALGPLPFTFVAGPSGIVAAYGSRF